MKYILGQIASITGAGIAAACCLGIPLVLSAVGAAGLGFLIQDAYLLPIFAGFVGLTQWIQYRTARQYQHFAPFWLSLAGGVIAIIALGLLVTGVYGAPWLIYLGSATLVAFGVVLGVYFSSVPSVTPPADAAGGKIESPTAPAPDR